MNERRSHSLAVKAALALALGSALPVVASAAQPSTLYGIVQHVSATNLKIQDPKTGHTYTFLTTPQINAVTGPSAGTKQQRTLHAGQYVQVLYSHFLGAMKARHVKVLDNSNMTMKKVGT
jgi:hypothetical protein